MHRTRDGLEYELRGNCFVDRADASMLPVLDPEGGGSAVKTGVYNQRVRFALEPVSGHHCIGASHTLDFGKPVLPVAPNQFGWNAELLQPLEKSSAETGRAQGVELIA